MNNPRLAIPPEEKRYLDSLRLTREDMDEAWARGWNCARHVIIQAILDMPSALRARDQAPMPLNTTLPEDNLVIGANAIAQEIFGGRLNSRQVYRLLETDPGWPAFKLANKWAARPGAMREEIRRRGVEG